MSRHLRVLAGVMVAMIAGTGGLARGHTPSNGHLTLVGEGDQLRGRLDLAVRDLDAALAIDDGDGSITWRELTVRTADIQAYIHDRLGISADGAACRLEFTGAALVDLSDGTYWAQPVTATCATPPRRVTLAYALLFEVDAQHRGLLAIAAHVAVARAPTPLTFVLDRQSSTLAFVGEGIRHIWIGIDHVLFLVCLLLPAVRSRRDGRIRPAGSLGEAGAEMLKVVTAFTIAHSLTLLLASVGWVQLPSRLVETAIALSVVVAAVNNLVRLVDARWMVAFALGLLHGFGFASVLVDLGIPTGPLLGALFGFNLGVELGQLAIVAVVLPLLYLIRRTWAYALVLWVGSAAAAVIGLVWMYQRFTGT